MKSVFFLIILALLFYGCISQPEHVEKSNASIQPNIQVPVQKVKIEENISTEEPTEDITIPFLEEAKNFAKSTSTYSFDGSDLQFSNYSKGTYEFFFNSSNSGYGNRSNEYGDSKPTTHILVLKHNGSGFYYALLDDIYDEIHSILLVKTCPGGYKKFEWENGSFCFRPSSTDGMPCTSSKQCEKGACKSRSSGTMGPRGICMDYMYGCHSWLYDRKVTRVDICTSRDYP